jgi:hypothetical protein
MIISKKGTKSIILTCSIQTLENRCRLISSRLRLSWIFTTLTLTTILISSVVPSVFSPSSTSSPMFLKMGFASATSSDNNGGTDESNTDATTDGENGDEQENSDDNNNNIVQLLEQGVQEEAEEGEEEPDREEAEDQQQLATVVGEICDDFEDNDGDGRIDLADEDCAPPATVGSLTAPTTTTSSVTDNNSASNTTASGIPGLDRPYDLEKDCQSYEELGIPPPPPGFGVPPNAKWYDCGGVGVPSIPPDNTSTTNDTGGEVQASPTTTTTSQVGQIQQQLQQLCTAAQQQGTSPATISPTTVSTNPDGTSISSYPSRFTLTSATTPSSPQAPPSTTTSSQGAQIQQLCTALQQQLKQLPTSPDSSGDGTRSTTLPDGTVIVDNPNGPYVVTTPTGATITLTKPPEQPKDPNDLVTIDHPNGVSITWKRDGGEVAKYPGGIERTTDPFGKSVIKYPGGITIQCADGSIANVPEDGKWTIIEPPPAADIGERLNRFFFGSDCAGAVLQFLPLDERLKTLIPSALGG